VHRELPFAPAVERKLADFGQALPQHLDPGFVQAGTETEDAFFRGVALGKGGREGGREERREEQMSVSVFSVGRPGPASPPSLPPSLPPYLYVSVLERLGKIRFFL